MMPTSTFREMLPSCYRHLLPSFFDAPWPSEPHATCDRCTMLPPPGVAPESGRFFRPESKCCTYHPFLPNYALGGLLAAGETEGSLGRANVRRRLAEREGVVPAGVRASARYLRSYQALGDMGVEVALRCPYYDEPTGGCTVWLFREAVCTTWFCKLKHGRDGLAFWSSLRGYLGSLERVLARHCLLALGFAEDAVQRAAALPPLGEAAGDENGPDGESARQALWGDWWGREEELYVACYRRVLALDAAELARLGGPRLEQDRVHVEWALRNMLAPPLPKRLRRNGEAHAAPVAAGRLVTAYSPYDPVQVDESLWAALEHFDGVASIEEARRRVEEATGQPLSEELVGRLVQLELLVAAP
jgi:hypothetical protein